MEALKSKIFSVHDHEWLIYPYIKDSKICYWSVVLVQSKIIVQQKKSPPNLHFLININQNWWREKSIQALI